MTNQHGGARPKVREDDGRKTNRPPIAQPRSFTIKKGDGFDVGRQDKDGNGVLPGEWWTVEEITRTHVIFKSSNGDTVRLLR